MLSVCFVERSMFIRNILIRARKAQKMYTHIKHQRERDPLSLGSFFNDKEKPSRLTIIPTETLKHPLTRLTRCTQKSLVHFVPSDLTHDVFDLSSPPSGGFGGGFNGGGDGGKKGRKPTGDATANKPPAAKKPRTCGICHMPGHTRVTCPQR